MPSRGQEKGTGYFFLRPDSHFAYRTRPMPRIPRGQVAGHVYHVLNRGNGGATVFHKDGDYTACLDLLATAKAKYPVTLFSVCLMPNHFHLVVQPATDAALSPFMQWWMTSHVRRDHRHDRNHGHVWQGRFNSFPIQQDGHLLAWLLDGFVTNSREYCGLAIKGPSATEPEHAWN